MAAKISKGGVRKSKVIPSKTSLRSPYEKVWSPVVGDDMQFILQTLLDRFEQLGLKKMERQTRKNKKSKREKPSDGNDKNNIIKEETGRKTEGAPKPGTPKVNERAPDLDTSKVKEGALEPDASKVKEGALEPDASKVKEGALEPDASKMEEEDSKSVAPKVEEEGLKPEAPKEEETQKPGWTHTDLRKQLAIGINEVTRALEKNDLYLVLVCKSAKPEMMTKHIIELSYSRRVPACQLPRLSEAVAPTLGLNSVLALGFRKSSDVFREQVKAILPRVPRLHVPWLKAGGKKSKKVSVENAKESPEEIGTDPTASRKRKPPPIEESAEVTLQELKVKKIVPNPNKKRKVKVKKAATKKVTATRPGSVNKD